MSTQLITLGNSNTSLYLDLKAFDKAVCLTQGSTDELVLESEIINETLDANGEVAHSNRVITYKPASKEIDVVKYDHLKHCVTILLEIQDETIIEAMANGDLEKLPLSEHIAFNTLAVAGILKIKDEN